MIGTEHEFSINDANFKVLPESDVILREMADGKQVSDTFFGDVNFGKELQKTVIEMVPRHPATEVSVLETQLYNGVKNFYEKFCGRYKLLGLGMHPLATLPEIPVWDHSDTEYFKAYNKLFDIRQHGWLNIQALQINISYGSEENLIKQYNKIRALLPYLIAVTASSPIVEGEENRICDNRLVYYRKNQKEIPEICNQIIPKKIKYLSDYNVAQERIYDKLSSLNADILCEEWLNSSGVIIRFSRGCLEIKALDEQESIVSDMAVCAFIQSLMRTKICLEEDHDCLLDLTDEAILDGVSSLRPELKTLYKVAWENSTLDEKAYLPIIANRILNGSLAERIVSQNEKIEDTLETMAMCLRRNVSYWL